MSTPPSNEDLKSQLMRLGKNLESLIQSAWESPERQRFQNELEEGFGKVFQTFSRATADFRASDTGKQLERDLEDLRQQIASGEITEKVRDEILHALQLLNSQLEQTAAGHWNARQPSSQTPPPPDNDQNNKQDTP